MKVYDTINVQSWQNFMWNLFHIVMLDFVKLVLRLEYSEYESKMEEAFYNNTFIPGNIFNTTADNDVEILNDFLFQGKRDVE